MASARLLDWPYRPGDSPLRSEVHDLVGGNRQYGIVTLTDAADILLFSNPENGSIYGYDVHEGLQEDGSFAYTGEGQRGPQTFTRGNLALRDSAANGRPIRLFTVAGTRATYVGEYTTGEPTYRLQTIPDFDGEPREGIIFNLVPVDARPELLADTREPATVGARVLDWTPPDPSDVVIAETEQLPPGERRVSRIEFQLQLDFGNWMRERGETIRRLQLTSDGSVIEPDIYVESLGWIVEAKKSTGREYVRMAIGQVLDYVHVARKAGIDAVPVVLLPGRPSEDLAELLEALGMIACIRDGDDFTVSPSSG